MHNMFQNNSLCSFSSLFEFLGFFPFSPKWVVGMFVITTTCST